MAIELALIRKYDFIVITPRIVDSLSAVAAALASMPLVAGLTASGRRSIFPVTGPVVLLVTTPPAKSIGSGDATPAGGLPYGGLADRSQDAEPHPPWPQRLSAEAQPAPRGR